MEDEMHVTVIATGFDNAPKSMQNTVTGFKSAGEAIKAAKEAVGSAEEAKTEEAPKAEEPEKKKANELISDDDFSEIIGILQKNKRDNY